MSTLLGYMHLYLGELDTTENDVYLINDELRAGDIVNWYAGGILTPQIWGHTGVIASVSDGGQSFTTYEQNSGETRFTISV